MKEIYLLLDFLWAFCHLALFNTVDSEPGADIIRANAEIIYGCLLLLILQRKYNMFVRGLFV